GQQQPLRGHGIQCLCPAEISAALQRADGGLSRYARPEHLAARQGRLATSAAIDMFSRRDALKTALSGLVAASGTSVFAASGAAFDRPATFGAAVRPGLIDSDEDYSRAIRQYCATIVPEGGMLWNDLRPDQATYDFKEADAVASFAASYDLRL